MSTHSTISKQIGKDRFLTIYCHWDGYLEWNGVLLQKEYNSVQRVTELLKGGDLSCLHKNISPENNEPHTFDKPQPDTCVYYARDRDGMSSSVDYSAKVYTFAELIRHEEEFNYIFTPDGWKYFDFCSKNIKSLEDAKDLKEILSESQLIF